MHQNLSESINHMFAGIPASLVALLLMVIVLLAIWDCVWKLIALWKSARNGQLAWFICLAIINSAGLLPILYILLFQKKATNVPSANTP